jgi:hypothetical protein
MPDMKIHNVENKALFMGDCEFETGVLTVPANSTVPAGALLKRGADGKFAAVLNTGPVQINVADEGSPVNVPVPGVPVDNPVAVNPYPVKNPAAEPADISFRALIAGKVRRDLLSAAGEAITDAHADMLRSYGIIAKTVHNTARLDNQ